MASPLKRCSNAAHFVSEKDFEENGKVYKTCNSCRAKQRNYHKKNPEVRKRGYKKYISKEENRLKKNQKSKERRQTEEYRIAFNEYRKEYRKRDYVRKKRNEKRKQKKIDDIEYKVKVAMRSRLHSFLSHLNITKTNSLSRDLEKMAGCTRLFLAEWIAFNVERSNLGEDYQIDHVRPLSRFKIVEQGDIIETNCNNWTNLMPISKEDNMKKNNRKPTEKELQFLQDRIDEFCKIKQINYKKIIFHNYI